MMSKAARVLTCCAKVLCYYEGLACGENSLSTTTTHTHSMPGRSRLFRKNFPRPKISEKGTKINDALFFFDVVSKKQEDIIFLNKTWYGILHTKKVLHVQLIM